MYENQLNEYIKEFENVLKVFLPKKYYPIINQLYEQLGKTIK